MMENRINEGCSRIGEGVSRSYRVDGKIVAVRHIAELWGVSTRLAYNIIKKAGETAPDPMNFVVSHNDIEVTASPFKLGDNSHSTRSYLVDGKMVTQQPGDFASHPNTYRRSYWIDGKLVTQGKVAEIWQTTTQYAQYKISRAESLAPDPNNFLVSYHGVEVAVKPLQVSQDKEDRARQSQLRKVPPAIGSELTAARKIGVQIRWDSELGALTLHAARNTTPPYKWQLVNRRLDAASHPGMRGSPPTKECPQCRNHNHASRHTCKQCRYVFWSATHQRASDVTWMPPSRPYSNRDSNQILVVSEQSKKDLEKGINVHFPPGDFLARSQQLEFRDLLNLWIHSVEVVGQHDDPKKTMVKVLRATHKHSYPSNPGDVASQMEE